MRPSIEKAYKPIEVDLWGSIFETMDQTKATQKKIAECQARIAALDDTDDKGAIKLFGEQFDYTFRPIGGGKKKASTLLKEKWEANDLGLSQIANFLSEVGAAQRKTVADGLNEIMESNGRPL